MPARQRCQKKIRNEHVKVIVNNLFKRLNTKHNRTRMVNTNQLLPLGSLKRNCVKKCFSGWVLDLIGNGRILTYKLALDVRRRLRKRFDLEKEGDDQEARRLHSLLKAARKRQLGKSKAMDEMDTMPMPVFEVEDCSGILCFFLGGAVELVNGLIHRNENFLRLKLMEQGCNKTTLLCWKFMTDYLKSKIGVGGIKIPWSTKQKYRKVRSPPSLLKTFLAHMCQDAHPPRIGRDHARADI